MKFINLSQHLHIIIFDHLWVSNLILISSTCRKLKFISKVKITWWLRFDIIKNLNIPLPPPRIYVPTNYKAIKWIESLSLEQYKAIIPEYKQHHECYLSLNINGYFETHEHPLEISNIVPWNF